MIQIKRVAILVALVAVILPGRALADLCSEPVETESGQVSGFKDDDTETCAWLGLPYAEPPVGRLRWAAPQKHSPWPGVRVSNAYGNKCMQKAEVNDVINPSPDEVYSEDCLFLNIWRPARPGKFPVMFWVHGGGYQSGTGNSRLVQGDRLSESGEVVVVTINYRVNVFGFFTHPALREEDPNNSVGNYGSLDQVAALRWVNENIESFGGDPDNITIFGQSAGGRSICSLVATPLTAGLFQRAILQSGGCQTSRSVEHGYETARGIAADLGCDPQDLSCLRSVPADLLLDKGSKGMLEGGITMTPHHDGYFLHDHPLAMIRDGNFNQVPFMAGFTRDEYGAAIILMPKVFWGIPSMYAKILADALGLPEKEAARLAGLYPLDEYGGKVRNAYWQIIVDSFLGCPTTSGLASAAEHNPDTYFYRFDYDGMRFGSAIGVFHSFEVPFVFEAFDRNPAAFFYNEKNIKEARALSRVVQGYWVNFAKTGDPNGPGLPRWPRYSPSEKNIQLIDVDTATGEVDWMDRCEFWEDYSTYMTLPFKRLDLEQ